MTLDLTVWHDLGHDHSMKFFTWDPDLSINPQYAHLAHLIQEHPVVGCSIKHKKADGSDCRGAIHFDTPLMRSGPFKQYETKYLWTVHSWEPLHVEPSLLCNACGDHGHIREGKWVPA